MRAVSGCCIRVIIKNIMLLKPSHYKRRELVFCLIGDYIARCDVMKEYEILSKLKRLKPHFLELDEKRFANGYTWKNLMERWIFYLTLKIGMV